MAGGLLLAEASAGWASGSPAPEAADPVSGMMTSPADLARGRALFAGTCSAYCHQMKAGPGDAPFLFDCSWIHGGGDADVFRTIATGVPGTRMVAFGGAIPDADIWRIVAYVKSKSTCPS